MGKHTHKIIYGGVTQWDSMSTKNWKIPCFNPTHALGPALAPNLVLKLPKTFESNKLTIVGKGFSVPHF